MAYVESEENISLALIEIQNLRHEINKAGKSKELIFDKYAKICSILKCAGEINPSAKVEDGRYYDATNTSKSKFFTDEEDTSSQYNQIYNLVNFFLAHGGSSEQFASALSFIFADSKRIRSYPVKIKLKMNDPDEGVYDEYRFINFTQFFDDFGTLVHSCFIDLFGAGENSTTIEESLKSLQKSLADGGEKCVSIEVVGMNIYPPELDLRKNFTIFETLTDMGGVDFNFFGYEMDYSNASAEKCGDLRNYVNKKQLKEHTSTYLAVSNQYQ